MIKKRYNLKLLAVICLAVFLMAGFDSYASEISGEQTISQEEAQNGQTEHADEITVMDENGNITLVGDTDGIVETNDMATFSRARTLPTYVVNFNTKNSATTSYTEYKTGASGYTNGDYGADAAYLGTEGGKVKFMLSGVVGLVAESEVQLIDVSKVQVSGYFVEDGKLIHKIMINLNSSSYGSTLSQGPAPSYLSAGPKYYSYDGHYFYTDYSVMLDDYMKETRENSVNPTEPYYNYYQYLPLRSTAVYTGDQLKAIIDNRVDAKSKLKGIGNAIVSCQNTYGVNSLIIAGVAANESAWGMSNICQTKNNIFGLNAVDSSPGESANTYKSVNECVRQFAESYMSKKYLRPGYTYYHGGFLGNKASGINVSYASDPYWGEKAANMAWRFDSDGGNKDAKRYTIGIKDTVATTHNDVNVRNASNVSSTSLYKTGGWTSYAVLLQKNAAENGFYRIQSDGVLNSGRTAIDTATGNYNISNMYGYLSGEYVQIVHKGSDVTGQLPDAGNVVWDAPAEPEKPVEPAKTYTKYKTTTSVNYRSGAGTSYAKKGTLAKGKTIEVEDGYSKKANGLTWYRFKLNGKNYYVASKYVEKVKTTTTTTLSKPELVSAKYSSGAVTVTWKKVSGAEGYWVYRKESGGSWKKIKVITSGSTVNYKDSSDFKAGTKYIYTVKAYKGNTRSGYYSSGVSVTIPKDTKTYTEYKVKSKVNYRSGAGTSKAVKGTLAKGKVIQVEKGYSKKANGYTWYRFKLSGKNYYVASKYLSKVSSTTSTTTLSKPKLVSAKYSSGAVTVTWKKVSGAEGYWVYRKESGGSWKKIKVIKSGSTVKYKDSSDFKAGTKYIYTVKAYKGSTKSGYYSSGVSVTTPKDTKKTYTKYKVTSSVNYRSGAGTSYAKKGTLAKGKVIRVEKGYSKKANGYTWYRFKMSGKNYYVASKYLKKQ